MAQFIKVFNHGTGRIIIDPQTTEGYRADAPLEMVPTELHFKEDGAKDDTPSFAIVMELPGSSYKIYGQFSMNTLQETLAELGYALYRP